MIRARELAWSVFGIAAFLAAICVIRVERLPVRNLTLSDRCHTPVSVIDPPSGTASTRISEQQSGLPAAIVIHGLSANRRVMFSIGQTLARAGVRAYLFDSPGEGDSSENFSFAAAESCAGDAADALVANNEISIPATVFVGHSLGGAIAIRLADRFPDAAGTIAISPAPLVPPRHVPANALILSAQFDPPELAGPARKLVQQLGGLRAAPGDFRERRAVGFERVPWAMHSSVLADSLVNTKIASWARRSVGLEPPVANDRRELIVLFGFLLGAAGIAATLPFFATFVCSALHITVARIRENISLPLSFKRLALINLLAAVFSVALLVLGVPLRVLHLYSADYLASFMSLAGLILIALLPQRARAAFRFDAKQVLASVVLAISIAFAAALWTNWQFADLWPTARRALLILPLAAVTWPYFAAEETAVGPIGTRSLLKRWLIFIAMRFILLAALVLGYYGFANGEFLPVLMCPALALVSVGQRAASELLQRRAPSLAGAATLDAILAAWFLAAVFPIR
ncbi:MAG TPA: alpha/beta fold hydrolase [Candidatus Acidoferrales bacterium]|nr:alpha/beta fold hydrolase [Candidatus Acidoferrales bacterium]